MILSSCVKDGGTADVTYSKATAVYGDLEDSRNTALNAPASEIVNPGKIYIGEDFILIGEEGKGVHVIDNSNSSSPVITNFINIPGNKEFYVEGNTLYAESIYDFMKIDISNTGSAQLLSRANDVIAAPSYNDNGEALLYFEFEKVTESLKLNSPEYSNAITYNSVHYNYLENVIPNSAVPSSFAGTTGQSGTVNRIAVDGDNFYVITKNDLKVFEQTGSDINMVSDTRIAFGTNLETIFAHNDHIFLGTSNSMEIYDVSSPTQPRQLDRFDHATSCDPVYPKGDVAYVTLRTGDDRMCPGDVNALIALNIEDYTSITQTSEIQMYSPFGMTSKDDVLYVGEGANGLKMFDITNAESPSLIKFDQGIEAYDIIAHPNNDGQILIAGPNGLSQYLIDEEYHFQLESMIQY